VKKKMTNSQLATGEEEAYALDAKSFAAGAEFHIHHSAAVAAVAVAVESVAATSESVESNYTSAVPDDLQTVPRQQVEY
jgi:hypothetical protein